MSSENGAAPVDTVVSAADRSMNEGREKNRNDGNKSSSLSDSDDDSFAAACNRPAKRRKKNHRPSFRIKINNMKKSTAEDVSSKHSHFKPPELPPQFLPDPYSDPERELMDALEVWADAEDSDDPAVCEWIRQRGATDQQVKLAALVERDATERKDIEKIVAELFQEEHRRATTEWEAHTQRLMTEQKLTLRRMEHGIQKRRADIHRQVNEGMELMHQKHQDKLATVQREEHRAHLQAKHRREMESFQAKGSDMKNKMEGEHTKNQEKVRKHFHDRLEKEEHNKKAARQKLVQNFRMLQNRYFKQHAQRMAKEKAAILEATTNPDPSSKTSLEPDTMMSSTSTGADQSSVTANDCLKPTEPMKSCPSWCSEQTAGGVARHRHRKGITSSLTRQLSIEIHNEGVWMSTISSNMSADSGVAPHSEFIPWGTTKVSEVLDAIVCGEIPLRCEGLLEMHPQAAELAIAQGGQVRCMLFDVRTSEWTASQRRVATLKDQEEYAIQELERNIREWTRQANEAETEAKRTGMRHQDETASIQMAEESFNQTKLMQSEFIHKYQGFLDGGKSKFVLVNGSPPKSSYFYP